jgi:hypothetical protein
MLNVKSCRRASCDSDHYLVRGKYRSKIAYNKYEPNRTTRSLQVDDCEKPVWLGGFSSKQLEEAFGKFGAA